MLNHQILDLVLRRLREVRIRPPDVGKVGVRSATGWAAVAQQQ